MEKRAFGPISALPGRDAALAFTLAWRWRLRVISLRHARKREMKRYRF